MKNGSPNPFLDMDKFMADFRLPSFDVEAMLAMQRKNVEALTQANQLAVEGVQAVARRQAEIAREAVEEASNATRELFQSKSPEDRLAKQAELAKLVIEKAVSNIRELTEIVSKANADAFGVINKRVTEGFDEVRDYAKKRSGAAR